MRLREFSPGKLFSRQEDGSYKAYVLYDRHIHSGHTLRFL